jgi:hypothetical protein
MELTAAAERQKDESMAEPASPMNVACVARVDPDLQSVTIFRTILTAPRTLLLASHSHRK